jgi:hypothetical protein
MIVAVRTLLLTLVACGPTSPSPPTARAPTPASAPGCTSRHVHGVIRDATSGEPVVGIQVTLAGGDDQDDTSTDDDGRFELRSTTPARDRLVIFYAGTNVTRQLSVSRCDEEVNLRVGLRANSSPIM